jgi:hypothetical protein
MKLTNYKIAQLSLQNIIRSIKDKKLKDLHKNTPTKDLKVQKPTKKNDN